MASTSKYRAELLARLGFPFTSVDPQVDESPGSKETPVELAIRLAREKAEAVALRFPESIVVGCDQVAGLGGRALGKPLDHDGNIRHLLEFSGQSVAFYTALHLVQKSAGLAASDVDICSVEFRVLSRDRINRYVEREKPYDCAGGFKFEGLGIALFKRFEGDDPNALIGLPLIRLVSMLESFGVDVL